jgi:phospholipase C
VVASIPKLPGWRLPAAIAVAATLTVLWLVAPPATASGARLTAAAGTAPAATSVKHLVVIFQENISFDHYFGTYPHAANPPGEPPFRPVPGTPAVNGLNEALLAHNPNAANPQRLDRSEALTCDQNHDYTPEQLAFDHGLMDKFVQNTQVTDCSPPEKSKPGLVMDYYDGNTVTGLWNYAQHFAMSDNSYDTTFGPSTPGALNLVSGQTHGAVSAGPLPDVILNGTVIGDADPTFDDCSAGTTFSMKGRNIGNLLNARHVTWGWFQGGFRPTTPFSKKTGAKAVCGSAHTNIGGVSITDYSAHHEPFQYYRSTANPHHLPPSSVAMVGRTDRANHQYDLTDFFKALHAGIMPSVSFLKAAKYQDGHAGYSDPLDEQHFLVKVINRLQSSRFWHNTAVVIAYDDSDGWYDHQMSPILNHSQSSADALTGAGLCGTNRPLAGFQARCGYGPRLPLLVISPFAKPNFVDHTITDQSSILRFIEDNWLGGTRVGNGSFDALAGTLNNLLTSHPHAHRLFLNPITGEPIHH